MHKVDSDLWNFISFVSPVGFLECFQPSEMSLEEIEGKLGSLLKADTISQLKSGVWKERLEGFVQFTILFYFFVLHG